MTGLIPSPGNCRFLQSTAIRRVLCFDRTGSKDKLKQVQYTPEIRNSLSGEYMIISIDLVF
ncbi:hypothetical protein [Methanosarcina horonobensis]|uniref:hypothetical protein n=1 Tax=Methanosarcina horonobensis TaxID=418008 RepID=UPI00064E1C73|nr:hypothetical protein [Methanosarcina horonobensis]